MEAWAFIIEKRVYNKIQILGLGPFYLPVVYDILIGNNITEKIEIFQNLSKDVEPACPVKSFPFEILQPGELIDKKHPCIFGVSGAENKIPVFEYFSENQKIKRTDFITVTDETAAISASTEIGLGCFIEQNVSISAQSSIGFGVSIKRNASIGHHSKIGDFVDINPGATIPGKVTIGNNCTIGVGAVILDGVKIGENTFIGAGSVVTKDIPSGVIAYGNPCRVIRNRTGL